MVVREQEGGGGPEHGVEQPVRRVAIAVPPAAQAIGRLEVVVPETSFERLVPDAALEPRPVRMLDRQHREGLYQQRPPRDRRGRRWPTGRIERVINTRRPRKGTGRSAGESARARCPGHVGESGSQRSGVGRSLRDVSLRREPDPEGRVGPPGREGAVQLLGEQICARKKKTEAGDKDRFHSIVRGRHADAEQRSPAGWAPTEIRWHAAVVRR